MTESWLGNINQKKNPDVLQGYTCPGRLLNVLCMFSLRPVSMEIMNQLGKHEIWVDFYFHFFFFHQMNRNCLDLILGKRHGNCYTTEKLICLVSVKNSAETVWKSIEVVMHACLWAILIHTQFQFQNHDSKQIIINQNKKILIITLK